MNRRWSRLAALAFAATMIAGACASEDEEGSSDDSGGGDGGGIVACQVTDTGGVDDRSFNQTANDGMVQAEDELGIEGKVLESQSEADFEPNLREFVDQGCDIIIPVGFLLDQATQDSASENPDQKYAIVDVDFFDADAEEDISFDNVEELTFATDQAAFLAGYLAAGSTETGKVGTFGGINIPTVTIFMDGYLAGVNQYNADNGTSVEVLGWDGTDGLFTGDFTDQDKGKQTTKSLIDEGADIVMPVAGPVGLGSVEAANEADGVKLIWVDTDGCISVPDSCDLFLTSVQKKMDVAVFDAIESVVNDEFEAGLYVGTLENDGVGIPELGDDVDQALADKIEEYRQAIIDGTQETSPS
jgi:basic membrane protein A